MLSVTLLKLDETRLLAVLNDISLQVQREHLLKKNDAWFDAILTGISDRAFMSLDSLGRIDERILVGKNITQAGINSTWTHRS